MVNGLREEYSRKVSRPITYSLSKSNSKFLKHTAVSDAIRYFCPEITFSPNCYNVSRIFFLLIFQGSLSFPLVA